MAEDWKIGDLAVCLHDQWFRGGLIPMIAAPKKEQVLRVVGVKHDAAPCACGNCYPDGAIYLNFVEFGSEWWVAEGFRKVRPDAESDKPAREEGISWFKRLLKHHKSKQPETV